MIEDRARITPPPAVALTGDESIAGTGTTVRQFWSWAMSNFRSNTVRSMLAEYLVACAVGGSGQLRVDWAEFDVLAADGISIEVKASAYLQAWDQKASSKVVFGGLKARTWTPQTGYSGQASYNAQVYVFAVLAATDHLTYDALDTGQWQFWVLPASRVAATGNKSLSLSTVRTLAGPDPVPYERLSGAVRLAVIADRPSADDSFPASS